MGVRVRLIIATLLTGVGRMLCLTVNLDFEHDTYCDNINRARIIMHSKELFITSLSIINISRSMFISVFDYVRYGAAGHMNVMNKF